MHPVNLRSPTPCGMSGATGLEANIHTGFRLVPLPGTRPRQVGAAAACRRALCLLPSGQLLHQPIQKLVPVVQRIHRHALVEPVAAVVVRIDELPRPPARRPGAGDAPVLDHVSSHGPRHAQLDGFALHARVWVPPPIAPVSHRSAALSSAPRSPRTASSSGPTGASSSRCKRSGAMAPRLAPSSPSNCWRHSPRSLLARRSPWCSLTASSPRMRAGTHRSSATAAWPLTPPRARSRPVPPPPSRSPQLGPCLEAAPATRRRTPPPAS
jgi:hypothetical protein